MPIIALSANAFAEDVKKCKAAGMDDHLAKPLTKEGLARIVKCYVGSSGNSENTADKR